jgi:hypothetical protein
LNCNYQLLFCGMLLESMNYKEISTEVYREHTKLFDTTVKRLLIEYDRERKNLKIDKARIYCKEYVVKTAGKDTWIIFISKPPSMTKYDGFKNLNVICLTYYYNKKGLRFLLPTSEHNLLIVLNAHFFERYNERLALNLSKHIDMAKHFFKYNTYSQAKLIEKDERVYMIAVSKYGLMLGELNYGDNIAIWKTFLSPDITRQDQNELENDLLISLQIEINEELSKESTNQQLLQMQMDRMNFITGKTID